MNQILTIQPYRQGGVWVFDDPNVGLKAEPFVGEMNDIVDLMTTKAKVKNAANGFTALFSKSYFSGFDMMLVKWREEDSGNWYYCPQFQKLGWLCPALFLYFDEAPATIYVKAVAIDHGNPIKRLWRRLKNNLK